METWQFSLFFAALLLGYVILHLRIVRFEEHLRALSTLRTIDERLQTLAGAARGGDPDRLDRIESLLERLHDDLEDLRETTASVGEAVVQIPRPAPVEAGVAMPVTTTGSPAERVRTIVESRLLQLGYSQLRLLTPLHDVDPDADIEVQVECERGRMPAKGRVLIRNGTVRDVAMQTVAATFP